MKTKMFRTLCTVIVLLFSASFAANAQFRALKERVKKTVTTKIVKEANEAEKKVSDKVHEQKMYSIARESDFNEQSEPEELFANLAYELKQFKTAIAEEDMEHIACLHCNQITNLLNLLENNEKTDKQQMQEWRTEVQQIMAEANKLIYGGRPAFDNSSEEAKQNSTYDVIQFFIDKVNAPSAGPNSKEFYLAQANAIREIRLYSGDISAKDARYQEIYKQLQSLYASMRSEYKQTWKMKDDIVIMKEREAHLAEQKRQAEQREIERKQQAARQKSVTNNSGSINKFYNGSNQHIGHINGSLDVFNKNNQKIGRIGRNGEIFSETNSMIGKCSSGSYYNSSNQFIGKIEADGSVKNQNNQLIGTISGGRVANASNQTIGYTQADRRWAAAFYFFNYFKW
ncbi:hypothetical protein C4H11_01210 [Bacteroides zoogleoformans]|uniref:Uncharacterized protein n=2 Tax=Bacteroides zoogleoformans TaxID=28119 RepID=A0ABM6T598_9BACE|nr:hypothetical protein C4H11_01210 [Bacteroides zoogleoformans]